MNSPFRRRTAKIRAGCKVPAPYRCVSTAAGFTLIEISAILAALAILSAILLPQIRGLVHSAQKVRANNDMQAICNSMILLMRDVGPQALQEKLLEGDNLKLLVSTGDIPELGSNGDSRWRQAVDGRAVDFLDNYLIGNTPGGDPSRHLPTPADSESGRFAWRGSYMSGPLGSDPWGNRYMINIEFLRAGSYEDIVIYSAGPNEKVETGYSRDGLLPGGDDLIFLLVPDGGGHLELQSSG
jgi:type II secretory pathway pseudopilin PulG